MEEQQLGLGHSPRETNTASHEDRIPLLALTVNFISHVGGESAAHREDVRSVRAEVVDQSIGDKGDLLGRSSKTDLVLKHQITAFTKIRAGIWFLLGIFPRGKAVEQGGAPLRPKRQRESGQEQLQCKVLS